MLHMRSAQLQQALHRSHWPSAPSQGEDQGPERPVRSGGYLLQRR